MDRWKLTIERGKMKTHRELYLPQLSQGFKTVLPAIYDVTEPFRVIIRKIEANLQGGHLRVRVQMKSEWLTEFGHVLLKAAAYEEVVLGYRPSMGLERMLGACFDPLAKDIGEVRLYFPANTVGDVAFQQHIEYQ